MASRQSRILPRWPGGGEAPSRAASKLPVSQSGSAAGGSLAQRTGSKAGLGWRSRSISIQTEAHGGERSPRLGPGKEKGLPGGGRQPLRHISRLQGREQAQRKIHRCRARCQPDLQDTLAIAGKALGNREEARHGLAVEQGRDQPGLKDRQPVGAGQRHV